MPCLSSKLHGGWSLRMAQGYGSNLTSEVRRGLKSICSIPKAKVNMICHLGTSNDQRGGVGQDPPETEKLLVY